MIPPQNVSNETYQREVVKRREWCRRANGVYHDHRRPPVALVVLSCKRPAELLRLSQSLLVWHDQQRTGSADPYYPSQRILVDNGSRDRALSRVVNTQYFTAIRRLAWNVGMGAAINHILLERPAEFILFVEDDLEYTQQRPTPFLMHCIDIFREFPEVGIIKLKQKENWDTMYPYRRIGPLQTTTTGVRFHPWLPSPRWTLRWGQRPWYPAGIHNVWSLGPVIFRWCAWAECGPIPSGQGRGQAIAAEQEYALRFNQKWLAARPVSIHPFIQPVTAESPGFKDAI